MKVICEYVWIGGANELRSKARVVDFQVSQDTPQLTLADIPVWNYDGSSTGQARGTDSEVMLHPVAMFRDPFRGGANSFLVLCETRRPNGYPLSNSNRKWAKSVFERGMEHEPWYGIEQEYFIIDPKTGRPVPEPEEFFIDVDICMNCGLCAEYCPFDAIKMDHDYEIAVYDRIEKNIYNKEKLSRPLSYYSSIRPINFEKEETARAEAEAAKAARKAARQQKVESAAE